MGLLEDVEERVITAARDLFAEAKANAPAIEAAVADSLHEAGVPPQIASLLGELVKLLKEHFAADSAEMPPASPDPAPEPQPEPQPGV